MEFENLKSFNPRECISGKMTRLNRITANIFRKYISPFGITNSQLTLLFILTKRENINQKQLSEIAILEKSSLNRNLKRLDASGLINKRNFPLFSISQKGKILVNQIIPEWRKAMIEIEEILGKEGKEALGIVTTKLLK